MVQPEAQPEFTRMKGIRKTFISIQTSPVLNLRLSPQATKRPNRTIYPRHLCFRPNHPLYPLHPC